MAADKPTSAPLDIDSEDFADCRVVSISGSIDHTNSDRFLSELGALAKTVPSKGGMVIDLTRLEFITSAGLRALLLAQSSVKEADAGLVICGLGGVVKEVFRISMFDSLLRTAGHPGEAVAMISPAAAEAYSD